MRCRPSRFSGGSTASSNSVILRVSEARDLGEYDRFAFYDHMKAYTAAPPEVLRVDEKNLREYPIPNSSASSSPRTTRTDGIYLSADDRRHFVAWTDLDKTSFSAEYWNALWHWYAKGGCEIVAHYLLGIDLKRLQPQEPPPQTEAFFEIVNASRAPEDAEIADALETLGWPNAITVSKIITGAPSQSLVDFLRGSQKQPPHSSQAEACGYVQVRNRDAKDGLWKILGRRQAVYAKDTLSPRERLAAVATLG